MRRPRKTNRYTDEQADIYMDATMNSDRTYNREPGFSEKLKDGFELMSEDEIVKDIDGNYICGNVKGY